MLPRIYGGALLACAALGAQEPASPASRPAPAAAALGTVTFEDAKKATAEQPALRIFTSAEGFTARHALDGDEARRFDLGLRGGAQLRFGADDFAVGFVRSSDLGPRFAWVAALGAREDGSAQRCFAVAERKGSPASVPSSVRTASVYPLSAEKDHLDAFWIAGAEAAPETSPTKDGVVIGAGDKPRRVMRGHRFRAGKGDVASIRYSDASGGALMVSIALPEKSAGEVVIPRAGALVSIVEISPDLQTLRIGEEVSGRVSLTRGADGTAVLRTALQCSLKTLGAHDPQKLRVLGEYYCVPVELNRLTPWLGKFNPGRPVLETFARPGDEDR